MALTSVIYFMLVAIIHQTISQSFNPAILQDSRVSPKVDGRFSFLYRTEDGISHAAKGEPGGQVQGRFTYTDPTGLKVNYNYNAGSKTAPGYNYNEPLSTYEQDGYNQRPSNQDNNRQYSQEPQYERPSNQNTNRQYYQQPQPQYEEQFDDGSYRPEEAEYPYVNQQTGSRQASLRGNSLNNY